MRMSLSPNSCMRAGRQADAEAQRRSCIAVPQTVWGNRGIAPPSVVGQSQGESPAHAVIPTGARSPETLVIGRDSQGAQDQDASHDAPGVLIDRYLAFGMELAERDRSADCSPHSALSCRAPSQGKVDTLQVVLCTTALAG
jgi:hypothetical protein